MSPGNNFKNIDLLIAMSDLQQFTQPSTTAVGTTVPSGEDFQQNRTQNLANLVGSIGPAPDMLGGLSEEELLEIVMSVSTPMGMGSVTGGRIAKISEDMFQKKGQKALERILGKLSGGTKKIRTIDKSGKIVKGTIPKTNLDYAKERIPWWRELNKQGMRFLKGRGDKTWYNKPEILSKAVKPPYVSKKEYTKGLDIEDFNFKDKMNYFFDKFESELKKGISDKKLTKDYGKVYTEMKPHFKSKFDKGLQHSTGPKDTGIYHGTYRYQIEKETAKRKAESLWKKEVLSDIELKNKIAKAELGVKKVQDIYKIADPDKGRVVDPITEILNYFSKN